MSAQTKLPDDCIGSIAEFQMAATLARLRYAALFWKKPMKGMTHDNVRRMPVQGGKVFGIGCAPRGEGMLVPSLPIPERRKRHDERLFPL